MFYTHEAIITTKIFMQFLQPKTHRGKNAIMFYYFPSPGINNNKMYYVESIAEHIKATLSIHEQCAGTIR